MRERIAAVKHSALQAESRPTVFQRSNVGFKSSVSSLACSVTSPPIATNAAVSPVIYA